MAILKDQQGIRTPWCVMWTFTILQLNRVSHVLPSHPVIKGLDVTILIVNDFEDSCDTSIGRESRRRAPSSSTVLGYSPCQCSGYLVSVLTRKLCCAMRVPKCLCAHWTDTVASHQPNKFNMWAIHGRSEQGSASKMQSARVSHSRHIRCRGMSMRPTAPTFPLCMVVERNLRCCTGSPHAPLRRVRN